MSLADREPISQLPVPAERVRLRTLYGITQRELAAELNVTRKAIYSWEHGISEPTGKNRAQYSSLLAAWQLRESTL